MMEENLPPGFRFHPTDEELITHYLSHKVSDISFTCKAIVDVDLNKCEPWDLPGKASMGEKKWYFFNLRDRKYPTGLRANRATEAGYWKTTGNDREIRRAGILVGMKKTLVFYKGRAPKGVKSDWVMHEYRLQNKHLFKPSKEEWVVCRVFQKSAAVKKPQATSSSQPSPRHANSMVNEFGDRVELQNLNINANNPSSSELSNIATPSYCNYTADNHGDDHMNMMNLNTSCLPSWLTWPSSATLNPNLSMNSFLLKALQLKNYQPRDVDFETVASSSSSSKVLEYPMPPPQQNQQQLQEKPFNMDSIW